MHFIHRFHPSWCGALGGCGDGGVADDIVADGGEADGGNGDVGAARLEDAGAVGGADGTDKGNMTGMAAQAGDDTKWTGDDASFSGAGMTGRGKDAPSQGDVGVKGGVADVDVGAIGGEASGGLTDGGVARADRGERINSLSSSRSQSSSASFHRHLEFLPVAVGSQAREWSVAEGEPALVIRQQQRLGVIPAPVPHPQRW